MDLLIYLVYPALALLLFWGMKRIPAAELCPESDSLPDKSRTKPLLGFLAICILLHHLSQKTCAPWLPQEVQRRGLEPFVNAGYLFVSCFFFVSGFGLWKSSRGKEDYLDSFMERRIYPIAVTFVITEIIYTLARLQWGEPALPANGYSWFIFALVVFYLMFYLFKRYCPKIFIPLMTVGTVLYCVACYALMAGEWWFNSAPAFLAGLLAGKFEKRVAKMLRRIPVMASLLLLTVLFSASAAHEEMIYSVCGSEVFIGTVRNVQLIFQIAAGICFPLLMTSFLMHVKLRNRALGFLGSLTLEIYLIQGLFVEVFSYCFISQENSSVCYIPNALLYCIVVIALTIPFAWLLKKAVFYSAEYIRQNGFFRMIWKDTKVLFRVLAVLAVAVTLFMAVRTRVTASRMEESISTYKENNIICVSAGDTEAAISIKGEGKNTIVFLGDESVPCPSLIYQELTGLLSSSCRVLTVDRPGSGFSGDTETERAAEIVAGELHEMLHQTDADFPLILMANGNAGLFALEYAVLYPKDVKAYIGLDAYAPAMGEYERSDSGYSPDEYDWRVERMEIRNARGRRITHFLGYDRWGLFFLDILNHGKFYASNRDILDELYLEGQVSRATANERKEFYENTRRLSGVKYPKDLPCLFLIHYSLVDLSGNNTDLQTMTQSLFSNEEIQKTVLLAGNPYGIVTEPSAMSEQALLFISELP